MCCAVQRECLRTASKAQQNSFCILFVSNFSLRISMRYNSYYSVMHDGTVKQINPFTGTEVWSVPERGRKPIAPTEHSLIAPPTTLHTPENYCAFCEARYNETAPEKARLVLYNGVYEPLQHMPAAHYNNTVAEFRRLPNLFEIVSIEYWKKNYGYVLSKDLVRWKEEYIASPEGMAHVESVLRYKLAALRYDIAELTTDILLSMADAFFGGCHEMVIPRKHWFTDAATNTIALCSSGFLSLDEHYHYLKLTIDSMTDILAHNHYVRYISVFQNWLAPAGASFNHLHKQLVALDEWGASITKQIAMLKNEPNSFNDFGLNFAAMYNFIFAESEHAVAFVGIGHRFPTIEIYSKSTASRPWEHTNEEIRAMSNMLHAIHRALGSDVSCNEEWYYTPVDAIYPMPWHILVKLRINTPAGFEGGTGIFINPMTPTELRDMIVPRLFELRATHAIAYFHIAEECSAELNALRYVQAYRG